MMFKIKNYKKLNGSSQAREVIRMISMYITLIHYLWWNCMILFGLDVMSSVFIVWLYYTVFVVLFIWLTYFYLPWQHWNYPLSPMYPAASKMNMMFIKHNPIVYVKKVLSWFYKYIKKIYIFIKGFIKRRNKEKFEMKTEDVYIWMRQVIKEYYSLCIEKHNVNISPIVMRK